MTEGIIVALITGWLTLVGVKLFMSRISGISAVVARACAMAVTITSTCIMGLST